MVLKEKARNKTVWSVTSALGQWRRAFVELPDSRLFQVKYVLLIYKCFELKTIILCSIYS